MTRAHTLGKVDVSSYWWLENQDWQNILCAKDMPFSGHKFSRFFIFFFYFYSSNFFKGHIWYILHSNITVIFILHLIEEDKFQMRDISFYLFCWYRSLIFICQKVAAGKLKVKTRCNEKIFEKFLHIYYACFIYFRTCFWNSNSIFLIKAYIMLACVLTSSHCTLNLIWKSIKKINHI